MRKCVVSGWEREKEKGCFLRKVQSEPTAWLWAKRVSSAARKHVQLMWSNRKVTYKSNIHTRGWVNFFRQWLSFSLLTCHTLDYSGRAWLLFPIWNAYKLQGLDLFFSVTAWPRDCFHLYFTVCEFLFYYFVRFLRLNKNDTSGRLIVGFKSGNTHTDSPSEGHLFCAHRTKSLVFPVWRRSAATIRTTCRIISRSYKWKFYLRKFSQF